MQKPNHLKASSLLLKTFSSLLIALLLVMAPSGCRQAPLNATITAVAKDAASALIRDSYIKVNYAFCRGGGDGWLDDEYFEMRVLEGAEVMVDVYLFLKIYEQDTGIAIPFDMVLDYFSEEYEPDGRLRLHNNGLHPEIEAFVDWAWALKLEQDANGGAPPRLGYRTPGRLLILEDYIDRVIKLYDEYYFAHEDEGFELENFYHLSTRMLDELCKKEADPSYELDLLSLQRQGY